MSTLQIILSSSIWFLSLFTSLQFVRKDVWWIRLSDFPHVQLTILTLALVLTFSLITTFYSWFEILTLAVGVGALTYQLIIIAPYTVFYQKQSKSSLNRDQNNEISILESNVLMGNTRYNELVVLTKKLAPDILIVIEADKAWENALEDIEHEFSYSIKRPLDNTYGLLVYSKLPLQSSSIDFLVEDDVPSVKTDVILRNKEVVRLHILHPKPPSPTENYRSTERDVELIKIGKDIAENTMPTIVAGDLNDVAWSHTTRLFQRISGLLDPRIGRGFFNTFNAHYPLLRWPLDHVFHSFHFLVADIQKCKSIGSDHFPMYISLSLEPLNGVKKNDLPEATDSDDQKEMQEKIEKIDQQTD